MTTISPMIKKLEIFYLIHCDLDIFSIGDSDLGRTNILTYNIVTEAPPISQVGYRESPKKQAAIKQEIKHLFQTRVASPSLSPWTSPVVLVEKKRWLHQLLH